MGPDVILYLTKAVSPRALLCWLTSEESTTEAGRDGKVLAEARNRTEGQRQEQQWRRLLLGRAEVVGEDECRARSRAVPHRTVSGRARLVVPGALREGRRWSHLQGWPIAPACSCTQELVSKDGDERRPWHRENGMSRWTGPSCVSPASPYCAGPCTHVPARAHVYTEGKLPVPCLAGVGLIRDAVVQVPGWCPTGRGSCSTSAAP